MIGMENLLLHLVFLAQQFSDFSDRHIVEIFLLEVGIPSKKDSLDYLVDSILIHGSKKSSLITKDVYPSVAKKYGIKPKAVEKSIERAIHDAWKSRDEKWNMYFLNDECITNAELISRMMRILGFWKDCCKSVAREEGLKCRN